MSSRSSARCTPEKGFYRSDDSGRDVEEARRATRAAAPAYYSEIFVDPWRARHDLVRQHAARVEPRRRQDVQRGAESSQRRTGRRRRDRSPTGTPNQYVHVDFHDVTFDPVDRNHMLDRQRRRPVRDVRRRSARRRRGRALAVLREPADHAVLSRVGRQRAAVLPRVRRRAGQLLGVRTVAHDVPLRHPHDRLGVRQQRRRIPDALGSRRSEHRLRPVAGRQHRPQRSAHGRDEEHPSAQRRGAGRRSRSRWAAAQGAAGARRAGRGRDAAAGRRRGRAPSRIRTAPGRPQAGGRGGGGGRGAPAAIAPNWDAPYIISPHSAHAAVLGQQVSLSLRRSRRSLDAHQPGSDAQSRLAARSRSWARCGRSTAAGRAAHVDDGAQHDRVDRRVAAARRPDLRRHRRRPAAGDRGRRQERGARSRTFPACRSGRT